MGHADAHGALKLTLVDGDDAAADDLGHVSAGVDRNDQYAGGNERQRAAAGGEGVAPVNDHRLHHHGRAAENLDINGNDGVEDPVERTHKAVAGKGRRADDAGQKADDETGHGAGKRNEHRVAHAAEQLGIVFRNYVDYVLKKAHGCLPALSVNYLRMITTRLDS